MPNHSVSEWWWPTLRSPTAMKKRCPTIHKNTENYVSWNPCFTGPKNQNVGSSFLDQTQGQLQLVIPEAVAALGAFPRIFSMAWFQRTGSA